jgi:hypothetical protein
VVYTVSLGGFVGYGICLFGSLYTGDRRNIGSRVLLIKGYVN